MPPLPVPHEEALARALAMGHSQCKASAEAGHARHWYRGAERAARPAVVARAGELGDARQWGETREVSEMIGALMRLAGKAGEMRTAAAMVAARGLLAEAAKLKGQLGDPADTFDSAPPEPPMSKAEWIATYGRKE
jgi:hypothetical protein